MRRPTPALLSTDAAALPAPEPQTPRIDGAWRRIAAPPTLARWARSGVQTADFTRNRSGDGTWQLVSCIRGTAAPGKARLPERWTTDLLENAEIPGSGPRRAGANRSTIEEGPR
jgi:hypothetical protein